MTTIKRKERGMMQQNTELDHRLGRVRAELSAAGIDVLVGTRQATLSYLAKSFLPWRSAAVVTQDQLRLIVWEHDAERAREETWLPEDMVRTYTRDEGFVAGLLRVLEELGAKSATLGLEMGPPQTAQLPPGALTAAEYVWFREAAPDARLIDALPALDHALLIKSETEISALRSAAVIAQTAFRAALDALEPGVSENVIAGVIEGEARRAGNEWVWSVTAGTEVAAGHRTAYRGGVTQPATDNLIQAGDNVILDIHTMSDLYLSDLAGNAMMGSPTSAQQNLHDAWKAALEILLGGIKPGTRICDVTRPAYAVFDDYGLADIKVPMFGHGLGTCARTPPRMTIDNEMELQAGMAMALGVHLYQPGVGGMRIEQPLVVTETGNEPLVDIALDWHIINR